MLRVDAAAKGSRCPTGSPPQASTVLQPFASRNLIWQDAQNERKGEPKSDSSQCSSWSDARLYVRFAFKTLR
jgi:hypothetical protein